MSEEATPDEFVKDQDEFQHANQQKIRGETVPTDWDVVSIDDISEQMGDGGTPSRQSDSGSFGGDITWVVVEDVEFEIEDSKERLTEKGLENSSATLWPEGSVIVTTGASIGEVGIAKQPTATKQGITGIIPGNKINSHFLGRYLEANNATLNRFAQGTTFEEIRPYILKNVEMPLPLLSEQRKIATVLYTVDRAIEKTEEIKQQVERVRNGVRQDVFSRGIRESGKERTDDELKETYLGTVPEDWQLRRVDEVCSHVVDCPHSTPNYSEHGTPVVRTSEIEDGRYYPAESPRVDKEGYQKRISRLEPKPGDVVFTREAPIGETFKIPDGMILCLGQRLMQLRPKEGVLDADFLVELLYSDMMQSWFERSARGSTSTHVNVGDIEKMEIPVPPIEEQHRIVDVLGGFREQLDSERNLLSRHKRLKRGLMQDLLSGTVRTTDTRIHVPDEITSYG